MDEYKEKLKPRASREERLHYRSEGCANCRQDAPLRASRGFSPLIFVLILGIAAAYLLLGRPSGSQVLKLKKGRTLSWTAVDESGRQGLSMVLKNTGAEPWLVQYIIASAGGEAYTNQLNQEIVSGEIAASFLPMPLKHKKYRIRVEPL